MIDLSTLVLQFSDGFKASAPDGFDWAKWAKLEHNDLDIWPSDEESATGYKWQEWQKATLPKVRAKRAIRRAEVRAEGGYAVVKATTTMPAGPAVFAYGGIYTRNRQFNPGLSGTNIFEVTLVDYTPGGEYLNRWLTLDGYPRDDEDPISGRYLTGWALTVGSFPGFVLGKEDENKDRAVQMHFDWYSKFGLAVSVTRTIVPGDEKNYHELDPKTDNVQDLRAPFIARPCLTVALRRHPTVKGDNPLGHRYALCLTDDGNTVSWMLDGKVMDSADISGYFQSSPQAVQNGAYASISMGGSYQSNVWKHSDARIYVNKVDAK